MYRNHFYGPQKSRKNFQGAGRSSPPHDFKGNNTLSLAQPSIAHHLKLLIESELVTSDKEGRNVRYYLNNELMDEYIGFIETLKI